MWRDFLYYTKAERQGILVLLLLIVCVIAGALLMDAFRTVPVPAADDSFDADYAAFIGSLKEKDAARTTAGGATYERNAYHRNTTHTAFAPPQLSVFDPNTADSASLVRLGLRPWMATNILRYRERGGRFKTPDDFRKLYGLTDEQFDALLPYIDIAPVAPPVRDTLNLLVRQELRADTFLRQPKYAPGTMLDLNTADTTELKKIPGIGSAIARSIVYHRNKLGGFYDVAQLKDLNLDIDALTKWFAVDSSTVVTHRINLNKASIDRLRNHPYLSFYQAKAIVELRRKRGTLKSLQQFALMDEFTAADLERLQHYVCFE